MGNKKSKFKSKDNLKGDNKIKPLFNNNSSNSIVQISIIENNKEKIIGLGFFIKFTIKKSIRCFLMAYNQILSKTIIEEKKYIKIYYGLRSEEKTLTIKLDNNQRYIKCFDYPIEVTLIEIIADDSISEDIFLYPDIKYKVGYNIYKDNNIYLLGYQQNELNKREIKIFSGKIKNVINNSEFEYEISTGQINFGAPICLADNFCIIGIHKEKNSLSKNNYGIFIGDVIDYFEKNENILKINNRNILLEMEEENEEIFLKSLLGAKTIRLKSTDNIVREVDITLLKKCNLLIHIIEDDYLEDYCDILLNEVDSKNLDLILKYLIHYKNMEPKPIPKLFPERTDDNFLKGILNDIWTFNYVQNLSEDECVDLINAADYLQINGLINILSAKLAHEMCNCEVEEARKKFGIECDMTEEEIAEIDKYPLD